MWLIIALVLLVLFGGGFFLHLLGAFIWVILILAIISGAVHFIRGR